MKHLKLYEEFIFIDEKKLKIKSIDKVKDEVEGYTEANAPVNVSINGGNFEEASLRINGGLRFHSKIILSVTFPKGYDDYLKILDELDLQTITRDGHIIDPDSISINDSVVGHIYIRKKD